MDINYIYITSMDELDLYKKVKCKVKFKNPKYIFYFIFQQA